MCFILKNLNNQKYTLHELILIKFLINYKENYNAIANSTGTCPQSLSCMWV